MTMTRPVDLRAVVNFFTARGAGLPPAGGVRWVVGALVVGARPRAGALCLGGAAVVDSAALLRGLALSVL